MKKSIFALIIAMSSGLLGCATPYGETGWSGGYESNWLAPDVLAVTVRGNGYTSDQTVKEHALLQAAERAQQFGFEYFTTISNEDRGKLQTYYSPPTATTTISPSPYNNRVEATTTVSGGVEQIYKPARGLVVRMHKVPPKDYLQGQYYSVAQVLAELGPKYLERK